MIARHQVQAPTIPLWLVWTFALGLIFAGLGGFAILDNNEGLYAEIAREMLASGDWHQWIIPHLNGLPYMEKPPLLYWLTALAFALLGESEWSARLVPALSALFCVGLLLWFGKALARPLAGRMAALMFASGLGMLAMSHVLMFDMLLTALLTAALMCAYRFDSEQNQTYLRWSYACLALALLAKGLVALALFGLVIGSYTMMRSIVMRSIQPVMQWFDLRAFGIFFLIALPWHVAASLTEPIFTWFYFVNEHVLRFLGRREPHDYYAGAWWYYLPRMALYLFPWSFLLPCLLFKKRPLFEQHVPMQVFLTLAWLGPLAFFSFSSAKANYYLVAVMPFVVFHMATAIEQRRFFNGMGRALPGLLIAGLTSGLAVALYLRGGGLKAGVESGNFYAGLSTSQFVLLGLCITAALSAICTLLAWRRPKLGILSYLALSVSSLVLCLIALDSMQATTSMRAMANYLRAEQSDHRIYLYRHFEQQSSLAFYLQQPLPVVDMHSNDLYWGDKLRPQNGINVPTAAFSARLNNQKIALVVSDQNLPEFSATTLFGAFKGQQRIGATTVFFN